MLGNADTGVGIPEHGPTVPLCYSHRNASTLRRVLDGVVQEYGGDLKDPTPVEDGFDFVFRRCVLNRNLSTVVQDVRTASSAMAARS